MAAPSSAHPRRRRRVVVRCALVLGAALAAALLALPLTSLAYYLDPSQCTAIAGNIVVTCGFETNSMNGWTVEGGRASPAGGGGDVHSGNANLVITPWVNSPSFAYARTYVRQTLTTVPGRTYSIDFYFRGGNTGEFVAKLTNGGSTTTLVTQYTPYPYGWVHHSSTFVAAARTAVLQFEAEDLVTSWYLDDVSVVSLNALYPSTTSVTAATTSPAIGESVQLSAYVWGAAGVAVPTGPVTFKDGSSVISCTGVGDGTLSSVWGIFSAAKCTTTFATGGTHSVTAYYLADVNYDLSQSDPLDLSVKLDTTISLACPGGPFTYTGVPRTPCTATVTSSDGLSQGLTVDYSANTDAGTATASASYAGDADHDASTATTTFTIAKALTTVSLSCTGGPFTYTGSAQTPCSASVTGAGGLSQSLTVSYGTNTAAGTASASASYVGDANRDASSASTTFTIAKAATVVALTCPDTTTYSGAAQTPCSASVSGAGGLAQGLSVSYGSNRHAGTASASASYAGDANRDASSASTSFTIGQAALEISAATDVKTYDASTASSGTPTVTGLKGSDSVMGLVQAFASRHALGSGGSTLVVSAHTVADGNGGADYAVTLRTAAGTITTAALEISAATDAKTYDASTASSAVPVVTGLRGTDAVTGLVQAFDSRNVGARTLSVGGYSVADGNAGANYAVTVRTAAGTITAAALEISAATHTRAYDASTASSAAPIVTGLRGADAVTGLAQAFDGRHVGPHTLAITGYTVDDGNGGANYAVTLRTAAGTITTAALEISAATDTKTYDTSTASSAVPIVTGLHGADTVTGLGQVFDGADAGSHVLTVTGYTVVDGNGGADYAVTVRSATGTILPMGIAPENLAYTGNDMFWTSSVTATSVTVALSFTIRTTLGDITSARPTLTVDPATNGSSVTGCTSVVPIVGAAISTGTFTCTAILAATTAGGQAYTLTLRPGGNYAVSVASPAGASAISAASTTDSIVLGPISVAQPITSSFITGGGWFAAQTSTGTYAAGASSKVTVGFTVKYTKSGTKLQGGATVVYRAGGRSYQIRTNSLTSLGVALCGKSGCPSTTLPSTASFVAQANLQDVTNPAAPVSIAGGATLQLSLSDGGSARGADTITLALVDKSGALLVAGAWNGTKPVASTLGGGNLSVR